MEGQGCRLRHARQRCLPLGGSMQLVKKGPRCPRVWIRHILWSSADPQWPTHHSHCWSCPSSQDYLGPDSCRSNIMECSIEVWWRDSYNRLNALPTTLIKQSACFNWILHAKQWSPYNCSLPLQKMWFAFPHWWVWLPAIVLYRLPNPVPQLQTWSAHNTLVMTKILCLHCPHQNVPIVVQHVKPLVIMVSSLTLHSCTVYWISILLQLQVKSVRWI